MSNNRYRVTVANGELIIIIIIHIVQNNRVNNCHTKHTFNNDLPYLR